MLNYQLPVHLAININYIENTEKKENSEREELEYNRILISYTRSAFIYIIIIEPIIAFKF